MQAQRKVLDVTAHNVANEATPGFHRQRVELRPVGVASVAAVFAGRDPRVGGVDVIGVRRITDQLAESRLLVETGAQGGSETMRSSLEAIERAFPEPSDVGLSSLIDNFFGGWSELVARPGDSGTRLQVLERAQTLIDGLQQAARDLQGVADTARAAIVDLGVEANSLAHQIADLNKAITGSANDANDLSDQRDQLVLELARLTGAVGRPVGAGQVDVYIGGRAIVSGPNVHELDGSSGVLRWSADATAVTAPPSQAASLAATVDDVVPRYMALLDSVANQLVTQVNALHTAGYDTSGATGRNFFDPAGVTAATIALSGDVAGLPDRIAAGAPVLPGPTPPGPLDSEQARAIASLADAAAGPGAAFRSLAASLGVETRAAQRRDAVQGQITASADAAAKSVGSVSLDEEMANLVAAQRAYEASARVLTAVDEMLGFLIERTGTVGR
jgi:flagellar hook-associated protein 1 FlgK